MAKVQLKALKTFYNAGTFIIAGDIFTAEEFQANAYIVRGLAERNEPATEEGTSLEDKTVSELREIAKSLNITGYSNLTKAELIVAIEQAQATQAEGGQNV